jgi:hypothetical protein
VVDNNSYNNNKYRRPFMFSSLPKIGITEPQCPYCRIILEKMPARKTKCPACGKYFFVRTRPEDRKKVLVTEEQVPQIERQWEIYYQQQEFEKSVNKSEYKKEKAKLSKIQGREPSAYDVLWSLANQHLIQHAKRGDWGLYRNTKFEMARILQLEDETIRALQVYLEICYLDLNGPSNTGGTTDPALLREYPPFELKYASLAPGIVDYVVKLSEKLGLQQEEIKKLFFETAEINYKNLKLPVKPAKAWDLLKKELTSSS